MASEITKTGLIPVADSVYKDNFKLSDASVGKYISLKGSKKFYSPGMGLVLSSPSTDLVTVTKTFESTGSGGQKGDIYGIPNKTGFMCIKNGNGDGLIKSNEINGIKYPGIYLPSTGENGSTSLENMGHPTDVGRILIVEEAGTYNFNFAGSGYITVESSKGAFTYQYYWKLRVNNDYYDVYPFQNVPSDDGKVNNQSTTSAFNINFNKTLDLKVGDNVQLYGQFIVYYSKENICGVYYQMSNYTLKITQTTTTPPTTSVFTNNLGIKDFNNQYVSLYGAERDTLILQGNKLTY